MKEKIVAMFALVMLLVTVFSVSIKIEIAQGFTLADLEQRINLALNWIDSLYYEINSTHAVLRAPFLTFRLKYPDGKWTIDGKFTNTNLPPSATNIIGGCLVEETTDLKKKTSLYNKEVRNYLWDTNGDGKYDNVKIYTERGTVNSNTEFIYAEVMEISGAPSGTNLYFGTQLAISNIAVGKTFYKTGTYLWGGQYHIRPFTKDCADLYYNLATKTYSWLGGKTYAEARGVDYLDRAKKLYRTWYGSGYIIDRFDGMFNVTLKSRPFPEIHGGIPPTPDYVAGYVWSFNPLDNSFGESINTWYNYSNLPSGFFARHSSVCRSVMPDDISWNNAPFICTDTMITYAYKSRTSLAVARNCYIANGLYEDLVRIYGWIPAPGIDVLAGQGTDIKMIRVCMDMYKYGLNHPKWGSNWIKQQILNVIWDGNGIPYDEIIPYVYHWGFPSYATHMLAPYSLACTLYYRLSGEEWFAKRADETVAILLGIQLMSGVPVYNKEKNTYIYQPSAVGGFMPGYHVGNSWAFGEIMWEGWTESIFGFSKWFYDLTGGTVGFKPDMFPNFALASPESTIPAVWALIEYRTLNRVPPVPTQPSYVFSLDYSTVYTDHGGSLGGDGLTQICSDNVTGTYIGGSTGNLWKYEGKIEKFRMQATSGLGEGWSTLEYRWTMNLSKPVRNFRTKLHFTIPEYNGDTQIGGNSLTVYIEIYNNGGLLITSENITVIDGCDTQSSKFFACDNKTQINYLQSGIYEVRLKFRCHAGGSGTWLWLGYFYTIPGLPISMKYFGFDCDPIFGEKVTEAWSSLSGTGANYTFSVPNLGGNYTVVMIGNELADFDLYAKWNAPPTTTNYDARSFSQYSSEYFTTFGCGTLYVMVRSYSGSGNFRCFVFTGAPKVDSGRKVGSLSGSGQSATYSVQGTGLAWSFLAGPDNADFDLYIKWNSPPSRYNYDDRGFTLYSQEIASFCGSGTLYFMVYSFSGSGEFTMLAMIF